MSHLEAEQVPPHFRRALERQAVRGDAAKLTEDGRIRVAEAEEITRTSRRREELRAEQHRRGVVEARVCLPRERLRVRKFVLGAIEPVVGVDEERPWRDDVAVDQLWPPDDVGQVKAERRVTPHPSRID